MATLWRIVEMLLMIDDTNRLQMRQWRLLVAMLMLAFLLHIVWACGWLRFLGIDGFAQNSEILGIHKTLEEDSAERKSLRERNLEKGMIETRMLQCNANSKRYFTELLSAQIDEYFQLAKHRYDIPSCADLN